MERTKFFDCLRAASYSVDEEALLRVAVAAYLRRLSEMNANFETQTEAAALYGATLNRQEERSREIRSERGLEALRLVKMFRAAQEELRSSRFPPTGIDLARRCFVERQAYFRRLLEVFEEVLLVETTR
jgi:hypothetical protein